MATTKTVKTIDIQLLNAERGNSTTIKLDNPIDDISREKVSAAMQEPLAKGWFLTNKGDTVLYLGDITLNTSIKVKLDGEDFYVTPDTLSFSRADGTFSSTVTVSGATIQGYNILKGTISDKATITVQIAENGLSAIVTVVNYNAAAETPGQGTLILVIQGTSVQIPINQI